MAKYVYAYLLVLFPDMKKAYLSINMLSRMSEHYFHPNQPKFIAPVPDITVHFRGRRQFAVPGSDLLPWVCGSHTVWLPGTLSSGVTVFGFPVTVHWASKAMD